MPFEFLPPASPPLSILPQSCFLGESLSLSPGYSHYLNKFSCLTTAHLFQHFPVLSPLCPHLLLKLSVEQLHLLHLHRNHGISRYYDQHDYDNFDHQFHNCDIQCQTLSCTLKWSVDHRNMKFCFKKKLSSLRWFCHYLI